MANPTDPLDRLMTLWQQPWSEPAYGEAQMLLARLRTDVERWREALERIVALDYRGHPSPEQTIARVALNTKP